MLFKNPEKQLLISFETVAAVFVVTMGKKLCTFTTTFPEDSLSV